LYELKQAVKSRVFDFCAFGRAIFALKIAGRLVGQKAALKFHKNGREQFQETIFTFGK
jgi:hypothetical protein